MEPAQKFNIDEFFTIYNNLKEAKLLKDIEYGSRYNMKSYNVFNFPENNINMLIAGQLNNKLSQSILFSFRSENEVLFQVVAHEDKEAKKRTLLVNIENKNPIRFSSLESVINATKLYPEYARQQEEDKNNPLYSGIPDLNDFSKTFIDDPELYLPLFESVNLKERFTFINQETNKAIQYINSKEQEETLKNKIEMDTAIESSLQKIKQLRSTTEKSSTINLKK